MSEMKSMRPEYEIVPDSGYGTPMSDTETTVLANMAARISRSTLAEAGRVDVRLCPDCGRRIATEEAELREQVAQVTAERDALVKTVEVAVELLDELIYVPDDIVEELNKALQRMRNMESPASTP